ncbi:MAG: TraB/GumN family protein [Candidatus Obscuribacterales bacterium]|nr:TraB/GumN family protein [Steroidobacteraceae bacterium]
MLSTRLRCLVILVLIGFGAAAWADGAPVWEVRGKHNTIYLFGSVHMLPATEPLPAAVDRAYANAEKLVMEIDMDDLDPLAAQASTLALGLLPAGQTLQQVIGPRNAELLAARAKSIGIDAAMLASFRPWLAAMTFTQFMLMQRGWSAQDGVELRLVGRATADGKEIAGLETLEQQLNLFASLPQAKQIEYLMYTLAEADNADREIGAMLSAWRAGDVNALKNILDESFKQFPELYRTLTVDRNLRWMTQLEKLFDEEDDYLIVVGALHLVGKEGLIDLLQRRGYSLKQLQ